MTKRDVTPDDSQQRFLAQHNAAMLEQCCNHSKQCRNNIATLCCARNRRCESSLKHHLKGLVTNVGINCLQKGNRRRRDVK